MIPTDEQLDAIIETDSLEERRISKLFLLAYYESRESFSKIESQNFHNYITNVIATILVTLVHDTCKNPDEMLRATLQLLAALCQTVKILPKEKMQ